MKRVPLYDDRVTAPTEEERGDMVVFLVGLGLIAVGILGVLGLVNRSSALLDAASGGMIEDTDNRVFFLSASQEHKVQISFPFPRDYFLRWGKSGPAAVRVDGALNGNYQGQANGRVGVWWGPAISSDDKVDVDKPTVTVLLPMREASRNQFLMMKVQLPIVFAESIRSPNAGVERDPARRVTTFFGRFTNQNTTLKRELRFYVISGVKPSPQELWLLLKPVSWFWAAVISVIFGAIISVTWFRPAMHACWYEITHAGNER